MGKIVHFNSTLDQKGNKIPTVPCSAFFSWCKETSECNLGPKFAFLKYSLAKANKKKCKKLSL